MGEMFVNVDGEERKVIDAYVNVDGVWRPGHIYTNIDGSYELMEDFTAKAEDIIAFKIIYKCDYDAIYSRLPDLRYNPKLPASLNLLGIDSQSNTNTHGVVFRYTNENESDQLNHDDIQEGILKYTARLYAILSNGLVIDVTSPRDDIKHIPRYQVTDETESNRLMNLDIQIYYKLSYVVNGINTEGWNSIFSKTNNIGTLKDGDEYQEYVTKPEFVHLSPANKREDDFYELTEIGIARDLHTYGKNMNGSHGYFTHEYVRIDVNGEPRPFTIEIQN